MRKKIYVITTGGSIITAADVLRNAGLMVKDVVVLVDREQGGNQLMDEFGLKLRSVLKISEIVSTLKRKELIDEDTHKVVYQYIHDNSIS